MWRQPPSAVCCRVPHFWPLLPEVGISIPVIPTGASEYERRGGTLCSLEASLTPSRLRN